MSADLKVAIAAIDAAVAEPGRGLPEPVFQLVSRLTPLVNVDLLIRDTAGRVLLTWRADSFYGPGWHIPGGIVRFKERWEQRIAAVVAAELASQVAFDARPLLVSQPMHTSRAIRGHFVSLLFDCWLTGPLDEQRAAIEATPQHGQWAWHQGRPRNLIDVHQRIYGDLLADLPPRAGPPY